MQVKEFQNEIIEFIEAWQNKRQYKTNEQITFNHLVEEVGELATQYVNQAARKDRYNEAKIENAIGDILMQVVKLAHLRGLDIEQTVLKIIKNEQSLLN